VHSLIYTARFHRSLLELPGLTPLTWLFSREHRFTSN